MAYSAIQNISDNFNDMVTQTGQNGHPDALSRYYGGHNRTSHPYVNGYWQFYISPPCRIFQQVATNASLWFHATAEGFTPPSRNLNKADLPGQGGVGSSWVTGQSLQRTFSVTHREYREMPVGKLYELWTSVIVPHVGVSEFKGSEWAATSYKGHAFVILTKPTGNQAAGWQIKGEKARPEDIEECWYFDGVWPENQPIDSLAQDISSNDIVQYTINFSFDGWPLSKTDEGVVETAVKMLNQYNYEETYNNYIDKGIKTMTTGCATSTLTA